jgi:hypothetical protein
MRTLPALCATAALAAVGPSLADAQSTGTGSRGATPNARSVGVLGKQLLGSSQAGRLLQVGQRLPAGFDAFTSLNAIPAPVRALLPRGFNYVQQAGSIAVVDPASRIVRQVIPLPH